jgi:hypothetical protein
MDNDGTVYVGLDVHKESITVAYAMVSIWFPAETVDAMYTKKRTQHGKSRGAVRDNRPDAREGQAGCFGMTERSVVPLKPGNGEGPGDWATYQLRLSVQPLQTALPAKTKAEAGYRFYALYDKIYREDGLAHAYAQRRSNRGAPGVDRQDLGRNPQQAVVEVEEWLH